MRGYPLRDQTGESKRILSIEQRHFWDWYPFRLFRVGGAVFADVGRTWGGHPVGGAELGLLKDIGVGLRFAPTRSGSRKIVHLDIAFPLDRRRQPDGTYLDDEYKIYFGFGSTF